MEIQTSRLSNGLRLLYLEDKNIMTVHCGFIINVGSRDETAEENGLAHLIEHCLFKGTKHRKAFHILTRLDVVGGEINAYTTKEETCIYSTTLMEHFERSVELLVDIAFSSQFPDKEIRKEKLVIADEINSYMDSPDEMLIDDFEAQMFPNHSLGRPILGTVDRVAKFERSDILDFVQRLYTADNMVFAVVGNVSSKQIDRISKKYLETLPLQQSTSPERMHPQSEIFNGNKTHNVHQIHALLGCQTIGLEDDRRRAMVLMNNILGGPALNSRLNLQIREKYGYCYYIESNYHAYSDCGIFQIYFGTDQRHYKRVTKLIERELQLLAHKKLTDRALSVAQKQLIGQIAVAQENRGSLMLSLGKAFLNFGRIDSFEEIKEQVHEISASDIQTLAGETFIEQPLSALRYIPIKE